MIKNLETEKTGQNESNHTPPLDNYSDCKRFFNQCSGISQFCDKVFILSNQTEVISYLLDKINDLDNGGKKAIYQYFAKLLCEKEEIDFLQDMKDILTDHSFITILSASLAAFFYKVFPNAGIKEDKSESIISEVLYNDLFRPKFLIRPPFQYDFTPLYCTEFQYDRTYKFYKFDDTITDPFIIMQTNSFWKLWNDIGTLQRDFIMTNQISDQCIYLSPNERAPFRKGPVALLFAGGQVTSKPNYYADETNCCLLAHHLNEMGYQQENIMCFVEGKVFKSTFFPPFMSDQICFSNIVLCSYQHFKGNLGFRVFERPLNDSAVFSYSIVKAVMDSRGPVLIYFSDHGGEYPLSFTTKDVHGSKSKIEQHSFIELCDFLETLEKHVLFILDCCGSEEFVCFDQSNHYNFIHFITSSINQNDIPCLTRSVSLYTKCFVHETQEIKLSSQFMRFFLDSIHSITSRTKLSEFVALINSKGNVGFKARLRSNNPSIPVSIFLQAPLFKYIDYTELVDTYQQGDVFYSGDDVFGKYLGIDSCAGIVKYDELIVTSSKSDAEDTDFKRILEEEEEEDEDDDYDSQQKIQLDYREMKLIINATVDHFASSMVELHTKKNKEMRNPAKEDLDIDEIYFWLIRKYVINDSEALIYATHLLPLYLCYPENKDEIIEFIEREVETVKNSEQLI